MAHRRFLARPLAPGLARPPRSPRALLPAGVLLALVGLLGPVQSAHADDVATDVSTGTAQSVRAGTTQKSDRAETAQETQKTEKTAKTEATEATGRTGQAEKAEKKAYVETRLYFGTVRPSGGPAVTREEFRRFVDESVTPRFPNGLTVQEGHGQYRDTLGVVEHEDSYELTLFYPVAQRASADAAIEAIRSEYTRRFDQESVARVDHEVTVDF